MYNVTRTPHYDFPEESYKNLYPNLHPYPATMLPQLAVKILEELQPPRKRTLLDPYCGSGSSFCAALELGFSKLQGYDLNPFAVALTRARFTPINKNKLLKSLKSLQNKISHPKKHKAQPPSYRNISYWFSEDVIQTLSGIHTCIQDIPSPRLKRLFLIPFYATARACSYTRKGEFKLYRMPQEQLHTFNPNPVQIYLSKLEETVRIYLEKYQPRLQKVHLSINHKFCPSSFDVVLTSPPYGDSRTTVAYGQFSFFANLWNSPHPSRIDASLMGGKASQALLTNGVVARDIHKINAQDTKRAREVSAFYNDLGRSIQDVARAIAPGGFAIYVVGNRTVKSIQLRTDQFIAEQFEKNGFRHLLTYQRAIHNKAMPSKNAPTNKTGAVQKTMEHEFIVVSQKP